MGGRGRPWKLLHGAARSHTDTGGGCGPGMAMWGEGEGLGRSSWRWGRVAGRRWKEPVRGLDGGSGGMATARWSGSERWARGGTQGALPWTCLGLFLQGPWIAPAILQFPEGLRDGAQLGEALAAGSHRGFVIGSLKPRLNSPFPAPVCPSHSKWARGP